MVVPGSIRSRMLCHRVVTISLLRERPLGETSVLNRPQRAMERPAQGLRWIPRPLRILSGWVCQAADLILLGGAFLAVATLPYLRPDHGSFANILQLRLSLRNVFVAALCLSTWRVILMSVGVYAPMRTRSQTDYLFRCIIGLNSCAGVVGLVQVVLRPGRDAWHVVETFWIVALCLTASLRIVLLLFDRLLRPIFRRGRNLIIVGSGERARQLFEELKLHTEWKYRLVGFVDSEPQGSSVPPELLLGGIDQLEQILLHAVVDEVVIALPIKSQYETFDNAVKICRTLGIRSRYLTDYFGTSAIERRDAADGRS